MKVLITGANGFIGKNLQLHLAERKDVQVVCFTRDDDVAQLPALLQDVDFVFHLAGINRPQDPAEFVSGNVDLTRALCLAVGAVAEATGKSVPIVYTSSAQAGRDNAYGQSKRGAEGALLALARSHRVPVHIFRLPNVFGKWCKPNYNSAVATFCHNIARGLPIQVNDPAAPVTLVYVDDVIGRFVQLMDAAERGLDNVAFFDEIDPSEIPGLYAQCHAGVVALDPRHKTHNIPGKFLSYMQAGLPVLASINPGNDLADVINHERVGKVSTDASVDTLRVLAEQLVDEMKTDVEIQARCKSLSARLFSPEAAVKQVVQALAAG